MVCPQRLRGCLSSHAVVLSHAARGRAARHCFAFELVRTLTLATLHRERLKQAQLELSNEMHDQALHDLVEAPAVSIPAVFTHEGADYVVFTVGGNSILKPQVGDQVVAYRLGT